MIPLSPALRVFACVLAVLLPLAACERAEAPVPVAALAPPPVLSAQDGPAAVQFAAARTAAPGAAYVVGSYTRGCLAGAEQLALDGPHWQVMNPSRNRAWGHPRLVAFVKRLAAQMAAEGHRGLLVGDLAQPRGGPLPSDHNSHQSGLDADIWLTPMHARRMSAVELDAYEPASMVDFPRLAIAPSFGAAQAAMVRRAAEAEGVERIFVSPVIKRELCRRTPAHDRAWLARVRPWRGHNAHMHVRLSCPAGDAGCERQEPVPDGDGCGAELASWFSDRSWMREPASVPYVPERAVRMEHLPAQCRAVLSAQG